MQLTFLHREGGVGRGYGLWSLRLSACNWKSKLDWRNGESSWLFTILGRNSCVPIAGAGTEFIGWLRISGFHGFPPSYRGRNKRNDQETTIFGCLAMYGLSHSKVVSVVILLLRKSGCSDFCAIVKRRCLSMSAFRYILGRVKVAPCLQGLATSITASIHT